MQFRQNEARRSSPARRPAARHFFRAWPQISELLLKSRRWVLYLDFDGTLVPLRQTPFLVRLPQRVRRVLSRLAGHRRVNLVVVSGRAVRDVRRKVGVAGISYIGLHGLEPRTARTSISPSTQRALLRVKRAAKECLPSLPGIWIEDKGVCFAVHYRSARAPVVRKASRCVRKSLESEASSLRILPGKKVWEVVPREAGKGAALKSSLTNMSGRPVVIFAGDDATDEEAFRALRGAITIRVGSGRRTRASYFLRSPEEVLTFLERLESLL